ncbi:MAG: DNA polymerase III subunit gamma/tau, partial [Prevotellaceae bacterium]|nr:DNA polymerase III subunit gamma/tau [Prevotellaceae bacterium]
SAAAFNAFLKTLEEPPAHVVFILATTEKHKILPTILSRCQVYDFERMSVPNIINHLKRVADDQGVTYDEQALNLIAEKADGGMRDALSIFDQAASFCQGNITYEKVLEDLNVLDVDNYFKAIDLALECKVTEEMLLLNSVMEKGFDGGHFVNGLATHVRNVLMAADESTLKLIETSDALRARYAEQAKKCPAKFLYSALRILNDCDVKYRQSSNKRLLVELSLIEVAQIQQQDEDGVGRGPKTKLKSLFKNIMAEIQSRPASQGAGTGCTVLSGTGQQNQGANAVSGNIQSSSPVTPSPAPKISISGVGMSFASILNGPKGETKTEVLDKKTTETNDFTLSDLRMQWLAMCNRMEATKMGGMAKRLKNIVPSITVYPNIELVVENEMFKNELIEIKKRLEVTMSKYLRNGNLTLSIRLAEQAEKRKILTPKENFEEMLEYSEALKFLAEKLQLELE